MHICSVGRLPRASSLALVVLAVAVALIVPRSVGTADRSAGADATISPPSPTAPSSNGPDRPTDRATACADLVARLGALVAGPTATDVGAATGLPAEVAAAVRRWRSSLPGPVDPSPGSSPPVPAGGDTFDAERGLAAVSAAASDDASTVEARRTVDAAVAERCAAPP
jgi:hypothetical protein